MKNELVKIGLASCIVGILVPAVMAMIHGLGMATPLLAYTIPTFVVGLILVIKGSKMKPAQEEDRMPNA